VKSGEKDPCVVKIIINYNNYYVFRCGNRRELFMMSDGFFLGSPRICTMRKEKTTFKNEVSCTSTI